jgi:hypothetical protein
VFVRALSDLDQSRNVPVVEVEVEAGPGGGGARPPPLLAVAFNPKLRDFLATGDALGRVQVGTGRGLLGLFSWGEGGEKGKGYREGGWRRGD